MFEHGRCTTSTAGSARKRPIRAACVAVSVLLATGISAVPAAADPPADVYTYLENPQMVAEGQEQPHVELRPYADAAAARAGGDETPWTRSLDGDWRINMSQRPEDVPRGFFAEGFDTSGWRVVKVPHTWQTDGLDHPMFRNIATEIYPDNPPKVSHDVNPTGAYVRGFEVPADWGARRTFVRFEGVISAYFVWVNGRYVGYDQGGYVPAEFDLTDFVHAGNNTIAVQVHRWSAGSHLEAYDQWRYAGIFRSTWLYSTPRTYLRDVTITTQLDASYTNATLNADVELARKGGAAGTHTVRATLHDPAGKPVTTFSNTADISGDTVRTRLSAPVARPAKWTDETPNVYTLVLELLDPSGAVTQVARQPVGFRKIEVKDKQILVNGKRILVKGVNHSDQDPEHGRHVPRTRLWQDVMLFKQYNINAVRTSHYPSDPYLYDLTDKHGLWVDDEMEVETHHHDDCARDCLADRPEFQKAFLDRYIGMVQRDKNHPSILMWDTGNEAGLGKAHFAMAEWTKQNHPEWLLFHQGNQSDGDAPFADAWGFRYPSPAQLEAKAKISLKPIVMGEYAHAQGNSLGNFREFWDIVRRIPHVQGGFIWDWVDQHSRVPLRTTPDSSGNNILTWLSGKPEHVDGKQGKAVSLSGLDDFVELYNDRKFDEVSNALTLDAWVKPERPWTGDFTMISKGNQYSLRMKDENTVEFFIDSNDNQRVTSAPVPADWYGNWHRVSGLYDGANLRLLIDGKQVGTPTPSTGTIGRGRHAVNIGRNSETMREHLHTRMAHGAVDNARIYHKALTAEQLAADPKTEAVLALDFDIVEDKGTYLSYGAGEAGNDGMVHPDRTPQPEVFTMAAVHAPIRFTDVDARGGVISVQNERSFSGTDDLDLLWKYEESGRVLASGTRPLNVSAGSTTTMNLPRPPANPLNSERVLTVQAVLKRATDWAPIHHVVAHHQFQVGGKQVPNIASPAANGPVTTTQPGDEVVVNGTGFTYTFDKRTGTLASMKVRGVELLKKGPQLDVWRAPLNNELWEEENPWRAVGLDRLDTTVKALDVTESNGQVTVAVRSTAAAAGVSDASFDQSVTYTVAGNGDVRVGHRVDPKGRMRTLPYLPRVGLQIGVQPALQRFSWYGRGPLENYNDRKDGAPFGVWSSTVDKQYIEYSSPQDYGNHDDVRWATLSDGASAGLMVAGDLEVGVTPYDDLDRALYPFALRRNDGWNTLHVDHAVSGVSETFHTVQPQYQVSGDRGYAYTMLLRPLGPAEARIGRPGGPAACGPEATLTAESSRVEPGGSTNATLTVTNRCQAAVNDVTTTLRTAAGWSVSPANVTLGSIAAGASATARVTVTRDADTPTGEQPLTADVVAIVGKSRLYTAASVSLLGVPRAPRGDTPASTLDFLTATNGWGPLERDRSNGEEEPGDGRELTIGGRTYPRGLGAHAESVVTIYLGGRCTSFTADVGIDDETGSGSVVFEVYADDTQKWVSPRLTGADAPTTADVNIAGATMLRLRVTDAGDGNGHDHADWAAATLHCAP
jgi:beta-galactosidase